MKQPIALKLVNRKLFIVLLFLSVGYLAQAQWTFTFQLSKSGPCPANAPLPVIPTIPHLGLPTQSMCESLRQQILAINGSFPVYDGSKYLGDCSLFYVCTACVGSDLINPSQNTSPGLIAPGDVTINGLLQGKPIFTPHQSQAFEEWSSEYKQLLASYGITSILGKNISVPRTPLTEDKYFNALYTNLSANFNPTGAPADHVSNQDANVVDLSGKQGVIDPGDLSMAPGHTVPLLNSPAINNDLKTSSVSLPQPGEITEDSNHEYIDFTRELLVGLAGIAPGALGYVSIAAVNIWAENAKAIKDIWDGKACPSSETILVNALKQTATDEAMQGLGQLGGKASGQLFASIATRGMIKKGVLPGIQGVVKEGRISEIGEAHFGIVSGAVDTGKKIVNAWGISTVYDDPK